MNEEKRLFAGLVAVLAISAFVVLFPMNLSEYHHWDETVYLQHGELIAGIIESGYNEFELRAPLFSILIGAFLSIKHSVTLVHLLVSMLTLVGVVLTFYAGRMLFDTRTGIIAAAAFGISPVLSKISTDILIDSWLPVFWLATFILFWRAEKMDSDTGRFGAGIIMGLAVLAKYPSLLLGIAIATSLILINRAKTEDPTLSVLLMSVKDGSKYLGGLIVMLSPLFLWSFTSFGNPFHPFIKGWELSGAPTDFLTYYQHIPLYILPVFWIGIFGYLDQKKGIDLKFGVLAVFALSLIIPMQFLVTNREPRYLLPAVPFIALILARGIVQLRENTPKMFLLLLLAGAAVTMSYGSVEPDMNYLGPERLFYEEAPQPEHKAAEWLKENTSQDAVVYTNDFYPILGYYSKREIVMLERGKKLSEIYKSEIDRPGYLFVGEERFPYPDRDRIPEYRYTEHVWSHEEVSIFRVEAE